MLKILKKSIKLHESNTDFKKCCHNKKKKIKQNLKTHISGTVRQIQLKFRIGSAPAEEILQKNLMFLFWAFGATDVSK